MAIYIEDHLPVVKYNGLNTNKAVDFSGAPTTALAANATVGGASISALGTVTSTSANALVVGPNGATNPVFNIDASGASAATGINIAGAAAASGVAVTVLSSGTNENLTVDAKGSGTITFAGTSTGAVKVNTSLTITSTSANALAVGRQGTTSPAFQIDASTGSSATGLKITAAASGSGIALAALGGTNESITIAAKGTGSLKFFGAASPTASAGNIALTNNAGSANVVNIYNYNSDATPGGQIDLYRGTQVVQIFANAGTGGITINGPTASGNVTLQANGATVIQVNATYTASVQPLKVYTVANANAFQVGPNAQDTNPTLQVDTSTASAATGLLLKSAAAAGGIALSVLSSGSNENLTINAKGTGVITVQSAIAIPAAGSAAASLLMSSTAAFGIYFGSNAPTVSAAQGSIYLRSDGSSSSTRAYINSNGSTTWVAVTTAS